MLAALSGDNFPGGFPPTDHSYMLTTPRSGVAGPGVPTTPPPRSGLWLNSSVGSGGCPKTCAIHEVVQSHCTLGRVFGLTGFGGRLGVLAWFWVGPLALTGRRIVIVLVAGLGGDPARQSPQPMSSPCASTGSRTSLSFCLDKEKRELMLIKIKHCMICDA